MSKSMETGVAKVVDLNVTAPDATHLFDSLSYKGHAPTGLPSYTVDIDCCGSVACSTAALAPGDRISLQLVFANSELEDIAAVRISARSGEAAMLASQLERAASELRDYCDSEDD